MKKTVKKIVIILLIAICTVLVFDVIYKIIVYPEMYLSTWKYQLRNDVRAGDPDAVEYYERVYLANGIKLFD